MTTVNIRPAVSVYATYRRLSYKPWYAIAEFMDNATQSYFDHREALLEAYRGEDPDHLHIEVVYDADANSLTIRDNAHGMNVEELTRAVVLDSPPPNRTGRCEYGMGLKTAACWFGSTWTIRTTRLDEPSELEVTVHVPDLIDRKYESLNIIERSAPRSSHYTVIAIQGLYKPIRGRTPARIRDQLGSMYRQDLRSGEIEILWNGGPISFQEPPILEEEVDGERITWRKPLSFVVPAELASSPLRVTGWVGIRIPGNQRDAGFALLRRGRVVVGGPGEGYKPTEIFGQGNTFRSQRLVGELHLDEWPVTQAKDAFDWSGGLEDAFIDALKSACQDYMDRAEGYRERGRSVSSSDMEFASERPRRVFTDTRFGSAIAQELKFPDPPAREVEETRDVVKLRDVSAGPVQYSLDVGSDTWTFKLHWQDQLSEAHWMHVHYPQDHEIHVFLNMAHPFFAPYLHRPEFLELLQTFVLALALAEKMARQTSSNGLVAPSDFRNYMNKILRRASEIEVNHGD
ncbi:ATP-binding protein [Limnochorda pilosa]|uniref:ATP-binding protein n=1 Tax=Limnochorda pilosa TaxID=1555112 RepID=UPI00130DC051|nr:ATP-binding protein [Limnochorda pilosa]